MVDVEEVEMIKDAGVTSWCKMWLNGYATLPLTLSTRVRFPCMM